MSATIYYNERKIKRSFFGLALAVALTAGVTVSSVYKHFKSAPVPEALPVTSVNPDAICPDKSLDSHVASVAGLLETASSELESRTGTFDKRLFDDDPAYSSDNISAYQSKPFSFYP